MVDNEIHCVDLRTRAGSARWRRLRREHIGASDIAGVMGWSPFTSPTRLYYEKTGVLDDDLGDERMEWGQRSERMILERFREDHPGEILVTGKMYRSVPHPFAAATPDALNRGPDPYVVEIKNVAQVDASGWGKGDQEIPLHYRCQVMWQMIVTGARLAYVPVLFGYSRYREYVIPYDETDARVLLSRGRRFWEDVEARRPPPLDSHQATTRTMRHAFDVTDTQVEIPMSLAERQTRAQAMFKRAKAYADRIDNQVRDVVGDASLVIVRDGDQRRICGRRSSWRQQEFDLARFREEHPDLAEKYTNDVPRQRFTWRG